MAVERVDDRSGQSDLWILDLGRDVISRFTFDPGDETCPIWSRDGRRILFSSGGENRVDLYQKLSSGAGDEELVFHSDDDKFMDDISPDGRYLVYDTGFTFAASDMWLLPLPGAKPQGFLQTPAVETTGRISPDGRWIAYSSNETGAPEVYVRTDSSPVADAGGVEGSSVVSGSADACAPLGRVRFSPVRGSNRCMRLGSSHSSACSPS